ncbi:MAG: HD-GYP domain-containing protein [Monoglobaceae bacterium]
MEFRKNVFAGSANERKEEFMHEKINELEPYIQALPQYFISHSEAVEEYVQMMADALDRITDTEHPFYRKLPMPDKAYLIGRYHDIGKAGISNVMWESSSRFSEEEYKLAQTHTVIGAHFVMPRLSLSALSNEADIYCMIAESCLFHHERWDGTGYPFGLKGEQIPLYARIVALADCYDAMIEERPYKENISKEAALAEIQRQKGKQFDPYLADLFCKAISGKND